MKVTLMGIPVLVLLLMGCAAPEAEESTPEAGQNVPETGTEQAAEEEKNLEYYLEMANDDISFIPVYLEVYGEVNLVTLTIASHPVPYLFITDNEGNILFYDDAMSGFRFWDVFVEDLDQDGRRGENGGILWGLPDQGRRRERSFFHL